MPTRNRRTSCALLALAVLLCASCRYMKMNPPADTDKATPQPPGGDNSCYLATAANMLAGAGYGNGSTAQARADDVYGNLTAHFGIAVGGWTDTALTWWLGSTHNTWTANPYTVVTVYGNKSPKYPWADQNGPMFYGNELRTCHVVGLSISWPTNGVDLNGQPIIGSGGHAITDWGDNRGEGALASNPTQMRVTDSDTDTGGDVQAYTYDAFTNPNPGGANEGNGWYVNYDANHPYIKHIVVLSPTTTATGNKRTQKVIGSYKVHQDQKTDAIDLHYKVGTDVNILTYRTNLDWTTTATPTISEGAPRKQLTVDWSLKDKPVPYCTWVTITTEFILPTWNAIAYDDVSFTYPGSTKAKVIPALRWEMKTPPIEKADSIRNVTGGYVIGGFDILDISVPERQQKVGEYRFVHEYSYDQAPEDHTLILTGPRGFAAANARFGHSYGYLDPGALWKFAAWMTQIEQKPMPFAEKPVELRLDWKGRLPYPEGEDIRGRIRDIKEGLKRKR